MADDGDRQGGMSVLDNERGRLETVNLISEYVAMQNWVPPLRLRHDLVCFQSVTVGHIGTREHGYYDKPRGGGSPRRIKYEVKKQPCQQMKLNFRNIRGGVLGEGRPGTRSGGRGSYGLRQAA